MQYEHGYNAIQDAINSVKESLGAFNALYNELQNLIEETQLMDNVIVKNIRYNIKTRYSILLHCWETVVEYTNGETWFKAPFGQAIYQGIDEAEAGHVKIVALIREKEKV